MVVISNKRYDEITDAEKATLFKERELHLFLYSDPYIFMDVYGLADPLTFSIPLLVWNSENIDLYFKVKGSSSVADYNFPETQLGKVGDNSKAFLNYTFTRTHPGTLPSPITETINITVKAYTDSSYTNLYGEETLQFTVELFDRSQGTIFDVDDFETDLEGWNNNGYGRFGRSGFTSLVGSYSLYAAIYYNAIPAWWVPDPEVKAGIYI